REGSPRHPSFSLRLQSPARRAQQQIKKAAAAAAAAANAPPAIVRNNSGEIVRPCLRKRAATAPAAHHHHSHDQSHSQSATMRTPRFVHFGTDLECVRWFLKAQSPRSVCEDAMPEIFAQDAVPEWAGMSQAEAERTSTVRLAGIRRPAPSYAVYEASAVVLERVELASTQRSAATLRGTIKVHNIAFEKAVAVRYSFDQWKSAHELPASYSRTLLDAQPGRFGVDRFVFTLALPADVTATLPATVALCVRYTVAGAEHWDSNRGANYLFRLALPAAPAIADDDDYGAGYDAEGCGGGGSGSHAPVDRDAVATRAVAQSPELCAPRRLTFGSSERTAPAAQAAAGPSSADTRRYMAQSAALFGASEAAGSNMATGEGGLLSPPAHMHQHALRTVPELPLFQDVAWRGGDFSASASSSSSSPSPLAAPMRTGSPIRLAMFDADRPVRASSPLAWSHHSSASALLC
ncbi:hypothetical protein GGH95_002512, partial [Coemansia sp. RSA 1836]